MTFYDIDPMAFPKGSQFFFNVVITTIAISYESDLLPDGVFDYWYLGGIKESRPFAIYIYRIPDKRENQIFFPQIYTHCVLELDQDQTICWYEMLDYETDDAWEITPILEDFDEDEDDDDYDDY